MIRENASLRAETAQGLEVIRSEIRELLDHVPNNINAGDPKKLGARDPADINTEVSALLVPLLETLANETESARRQLRILSSLQFYEINTRYLSIKKSHSGTFEWLLQPSKHSFTHWLRSGGGIYWVRGKAGSGKSTLMRFLAEHAATKMYLEEWAGDDDVVIASHYFWNAGSSMQKSQVGLLRTLLLCVFRQCPSLIRSLCPRRWESVPDAALKPWTEEELLSIFKALSTQRRLSARFCFFIDGLDEYTGGASRYHGSYSELIDPLRQLAESPWIKICVSSRPWTPFENVLGSSENKLLLETLTRPDIEKYVQERLGDNEEFRALTQRDCRLDSFVKTIATRAQGVFLWVHLVVNSLLNGISAEDNFDDLQARLDELPTDLEEFYKGILETIEPVYWEQTMRILLMAIEANGPLPILAYEFLDHERSDPEYAITLSLESISRLDIGQIAPKIRKRLNARCKDFLEVTEVLAVPPVMSHRVHFLHRTARDFFENTDIIPATMEKKGFIEFDSTLSMARVMLCLAKASLDPKGLTVDLQPFLAIARGLFYYARKMEARITQNPDVAIRGLPADSPIRDMFRLLDELDGVVTETRRDPRRGHWTGVSSHTLIHPDPGQGQTTVLNTAVQEQLLIYVATKLEGDDARQIHKKGLQLLDYALDPGAFKPRDPSDPDLWPRPSMVELLLRSGACPNQRIDRLGGQTPWLRFLVLLNNAEVHNVIWQKKRSTDFSRKTCQVLRLMLMYGAEFEDGEAKTSLDKLLGSNMLSEDDVTELRGVMRARQQTAREQKRIASEQQQSHQPASRWFRWW